MKDAVKMAIVEDDKAVCVCQDRRRSKEGRKMSDECDIYSRTGEDELWRDSWMMEG